MKILTRVLAMICLLWVCFAVFVPLGHPPLFQFWSAGAIKDADEIITRSGTNVLDGSPLTVSRGTLIMLTLRAKAPDDRESTVEFLRWVSIGFALAACGSLLCLSRRQTTDSIEKPKA
jgi:hypothetical protein